MSVLKWEAPNTWSAEVILALAPTTTAVTSSSVGLGSTGLVLAGSIVLTPTTTGTLVGNNATVHLYSGTSPVIPTEGARPTPTLIAMAIITLN